MDVSLAPQDQGPFIADPAAKIALQVYPSYTWAVVVLLVGIAMSLVVLGKMTNMLRDSNGTDDPPYSLAKHQMALWFVVIIGSYLFVWMITGQFSAGPGAPEAARLTAAITPKLARLQELNAILSAPAPIGATATLPAVMQPRPARPQ